MVVCSEVDCTGQKVEQMRAHGNRFRRWVIRMRKCEQGRACDSLFRMATHMRKCEKRSAHCSEGRVT